LSYEQLVQLVFEGPSAQKAALGQLSAQEHWEAIARRLSLPATEASILYEQFFAGDVLDLELLGFIRSLRPRFKTGLVSNAWLDMRAYIRRNKFEDAFDHLVISAEVGLAKPDPEIYIHALHQLGVSANRSVMIDDVRENLSAAQALGMRGVLFVESTAVRKELENMLN